jgi:hypothetical protein
MEKDSFLKILENDCNNNVFDICFETKLDEMVCECTDMERNYWQNEKTLSARKKENAIVHERNSQEKE